MNAWIRHSFRNRIFVTVLTATLVPLLICGVLMMQLQVVRSEKKLEKEACSQLDELVQALDLACVSYEEIARSLCNNTMVRSTLRKSTADSRILYQFLFRETVGQRAYARFDLFDSNGKCLYTTGSTLPSGMRSTHWGILKKAGSSKGLVYSANDASACLTAAQAVRSFDDTVLGYLVISMEESHFEELFHSIYTPTNEILLLDSFWRTIYFSQPTTAEATIAGLRTQLLSGEPLAGDQGEYFFFAKKQERTGFSMILQHPKIFTRQVIRSVNIVSSIMGFLCLLLCLWSSWVLSRHLARPIHQLDHAMKEVEHGNFNIHLETDREDELGHLAKRFNQMTVEYLTNLERSVARQKELNQTRLRMMQAQLNPHFLYNTLDSIKWLSIPHNAPEVAELATDLAALLRASISGKEFTTLEQELELLERYLDIQYIRFEDRFTCEIDIDEKFQSCMVPKLVLQPLVENSILHGVSDMDDGYIKLSAREEDGCMLLSVTDNGCGIPADMLEILNSNDKQIPGEHLGLYNVDSIIRLHYGETYGLSAWSEKGHGSCICLKLPMQKGEETNA